MPETQTQTEVDELVPLATKAIKSSERFPTLMEIADALAASGHQAPKAAIARRLVRLVESGQLDQPLREAAKGRPTVRRKPIHDSRGNVVPEDELGRKGHRELRHGLILRDGPGFRVCGKTTKDLTDAQKEAIHRMRLKKASWGEISKAMGLEYNKGMTARNIFLAVQRAKKS